MKNLLAWLIALETRARRIYREAALHFNDDPALEGFLRGLANDESAHLAILSGVGEGERAVLPATLIELSDVERAEIEACFTACEERLASGECNKDLLFDFIVAAEFSEWNTVFLYVAKTLKTQSAVGLQNHIRSIELFLLERPGEELRLKAIRGIPRVWNEKILIVDDDEGISDLLEAVLMQEGLTVRAQNGKDALEKLSGAYYAAIISDVDMPTMGGLEFLKRAKEAYPGIESRIVFFTGDLSPERRAIFEREGAGCLPKPSPVGEIRRRVTELMLRKRA